MELGGRRKVTGVFFWREKKGYWPVLLEGDRIAWELGEVGASSSSITTGVELPLH